MSRLTLLHINIIGILVCIAAGAALYFTVITSSQDQLKKAQTEYEQVKKEADQLPKAKRDLEQARIAKATAEREYAVYEAQYMPVIGYTSQRNRLEVMMRLFWPNKGRSWPERYIRTIRAHMAREQKVNGIVWENPGAIIFPAFGPDPNRIDAAQPGSDLGPVLVYQYPIVVRARNIDSLMRHIRSWVTIRDAGVPVVEGLQISGNSPNLQATYNLRLTIILRKSEEDYIKTKLAAIPRIGGQGGPQAGRGGVAGFGMGMPGAPGMGMPGMGMPPGMGVPMPGGGFSGPQSGMMGSGGMGGGASGPPAGMSFGGPRGGMGVSGPPPSMGGGGGKMSEQTE